MSFETPPQKTPEVKKEKEVASFIDYFTGAFVQIIEAMTAPFGNKEKSE